MHKKTSLFALLLLFTAGCNSQPPHVKTSADVFSGPFGDIPARTTVNYVSANGKVILIVWCEGSGTSGRASSTTPDQVHVEGTVDTKDGRLLDWKGTLTASGSGVLNIGDEDYDLGNGALFLVARRDTAPIVKQLQRDYGNPNILRDTINYLGKDDEIINFFDQTPKKIKGDGT